MNFSYRVSQPAKDKFDYVVIFDEAAQCYKYQEIKESYQLQEEKQKQKALLKINLLDQVITKGR